MPRMNACFSCTYHTGKGSTRREQSPTGRSCPHHWLAELICVLWPVLIFLSPSGRSIDQWNGNTAHLSKKITGREVAFLFIHFLGNFWNMQLQKRSWEEKGKDESMHLPLHWLILAVQLFFLTSESSTSLQMKEQRIIQGPQEFIHPQNLLKARSTTRSRQLECYPVWSWKPQRMEAAQPLQVLPSVQSPGSVSSHLHLGSPCGCCR